MTYLIPCKIINSNQWRTIFFFFFITIQVKNMLWIKNFILLLKKMDVLLPLVTKARKAFQCIHF